MIEARAQWVDGLQFVGVASSKHALVIDVKEAVGGQDTGVRPAELILIGLASCTGVDVVSILGKMRVPFDGFQVRVKAETAPEHPKVFTEIALEYIIRGDEVPQDKFERAIQLSQERYCSVSALLGKGATITYTSRILTSGEEA